MSPDGILRWGDSGLSSTLNPFDPVSASLRPVVLNRPFNSVADLGYAFRDEPWKTLDFFSANSADAALLDYFCVDDMPSLVAGKVNPNTAHPEVLKGLLSGAMASEPTSSVISSGQADVLASEYSTVTANTNQRIRDLSDAVTQLSTSTMDGNHPAAKTEREAAVRALSAGADTRTWNLLVDLVAQSGRFGKSAASADRFTVEGEQHYWLHLAIDRYTGKVIAQQYEIVQE
jgi:hypothetical protein